MTESYWKIVCKYGHVGRRNEVSVARYLRLDENATLLDAIDIAENMPGVKNRGILSGKRVTFEEFSIGRHMENQNFYIRNLKNHTQGIA